LAGFRLEIGNDVMPILGDVPELVVTWDAYTGTAPDGTSFAHYVGGGVVLIVLLALGLVLTSGGDPQGPRSTE
jgi:hypothetical protein